MPPNANVILLRGNSDELDETVLQLLSQANHPLCASTIAFLLNRPTRDICMTLNRLRKYRNVQVTKVTARRVQFWEVRRK